MKRRRLRLLLLAPALFCCNCAGARWSAGNSVHAVLLGPVQRIGAGAAATSGDDLGAFASICQTKVMGAASSGNTATGSSSTAAPTMADWHIVEAIGASLDRFIAVRSLACQGFDLFLVAGLASQASCAVEGEVYKVARGSSAASSISPTSASTVGRAQPKTDPAAAPSPGFRAAPPPVRRDAPPAPPPPVGF